MIMEKDDRTRIIDAVFEIMAHPYYSPFIPQDLVVAINNNIGMLSDCILKVTDVAESYHIDEIESHFENLLTDEEYKIDFLKDCKHEETDRMLYWLLNIIDALERNFYDWTAINEDISEFIGYMNCNYVESSVLKGLVEKSELYLGLKLSKNAQKRILDHEQSLFFDLGRFEYCTLMEIYKLLVAGAPEGIAKFRQSATANTIKQKILKVLT